MAYSNLNDLALISSLSNLDCQGKKWLAVSNEKLEKIPVFKEDMAYVKRCAEVFGVNYAKTGNTFLVKSENGNVADKVYSPRVQVDNKGQLVVAWGEELSPINPEDVGVLGQAGCKYWVKGDNKTGYTLAFANIDMEDDGDEFNLPIAVVFEDSVAKVETPKALVKILKGLDNKVSISDILFCRANLAQKIDVLDENGIYKVMGYEVRKNTFGGTDVIMAIDGVGKVKAQGNCKKLLIDNRPEINPDTPATLNTYEKTERVNGKNRWIQLSNRLTLPQLADFQAFVM